MIGAFRHELIGLGGVVERNWYLVKRYAWWELAFFVWTCANTLTIVFIAKGVEAAGGTVDVDRLTTQLLIGAVIWAYLGIIFEILTETVAWERWEGTIEYTFMAPLSRPVHLLGMGAFAVLYGVVRASLLFAVVAAMFGLAMPHAAFGDRARAARDRVGLVHRRRDDDRRPAADLAREGRAARLRRAGDHARRLGRLLPGPVLPDWMQWIATISPATYALRGIRHAILDGYGVGAGVGRHLAADRDRHRLDPARPCRLRRRRALREAARQAKRSG